MVQEGDRIELVNTTDEYTQLERGDRGTVTGTNMVPGQQPGTREEKINVDWDSGSTLGLFESQDAYRVVTDEDE